MKTLSTIIRNTNQKYGRFILFYIIASIVIALAMVISYQIRGDMTETALAGDIPGLMRFLGLATAIIAVRIIFVALQTLTLARLEARAGYNLRGHFIRHLLGAPYSAVEAAGSGESLSIYQNDIPPAATMATNELMEFISSIITFGIGLAFMLQINPGHTGWLVVAFIGTMAFIALLSIPSQIFTKKASEITAEFNGIASDSLQNISAIAAYGLEDVMEERFNKSYARYIRLTIKLACFLAPVISFGMVAMFAPLAIVNGLMGISVVDGYFTLADFVAYTSTIMITFGGASGMANGISGIIRSIAHGKRIVENTQTAHEELATGESIDFGGKIVFTNISFSYKEDAPAALDDISFSIAPGEKVAFVGSSGSGKSTVLKLLMGIYEPSVGEIFIGNTNAAKAAKNALRNAFAYVPQDSYLLPQSIGENISTTPENADIARLERASSQAGILDFVNSLPDKFDSPLAEASENISGGQRQRIALARAFYKDAPVILFDEATANLDPATESGVLASLTDSAASKTVIMVAHRARAIASCDRIIVMDAGKIAAQGTHDELLANSNIYQNLYQSHENGGVA